MASLDVKAPDGKTLTVQVPDGTDPTKYGLLADEAVQHYTSQTQAPPSNLPSYASPQQQQKYPISSMISKGLGVGLEIPYGAMQAFGEPIRQAVTAAEGKDPGPYRAPTIVQRALGGLFPKINTPEQAPDFISAITNPAYAGLKGITATASKMTPQAVSDIVNSVRTGQPQSTGPDLGNALQAGTQAIAQPPGLPEKAISLAAAVGSGEAGNIPFTAAIKPFAVLGKLLETGHFAGIPGTGELLKSATNMDAVPLGLENLTAHANPEVLEAATKNNVPLTPGGITGSPTLSAIEGFLRKMPFSSNVMQKQFAEQLSALGKVREPIVEASKPAADLGLDIQQGLSTASNAAMGEAKGLYGNLENSVPQNTLPEMSNMQKVSTDLMQAQGKLPQSAQTPAAVSLLKDLSDERSRFMDFPTVQALRSELNSRIAEANSALGSPTPGASFQASPQARIYGQIKDALDQDLQKFSDQTGGAFQSAYSKATKTYQAFKQQFSDDKFIQSIIHEQNPENVVDKVISAAKNNPRALGTLKLNLPSQTLDDLQTYFIKDMTEKDPNIFSPSHFVTQYNSIGEKQLGNILGQQKLDQLRPLYVLSKASVNAEKLGQLATGPSGAGVVAGGMGLTQPFMMAARHAAQGHPIQGLAMASAMGGAEMAALPAFAKAYLSSPAQKLLTRQIGMTPSFPVAGQLAPLLGKLQGPINAIGQNPQAKEELLKVLAKIRGNQNNK